MQHKRKWETRFVTALVILVFSIASVISTNQYQYGVSDHSIIIPFLKSSLNSNLYPNDFLLTQTPFYYTYLWGLCALLIGAFNISIPLLFFIGYCASVFFTFSGIYLISKTLFGQREVAFLSLFFLLFSIKTLSGSVTIDNIFLTRVAALPVLIFSVYYFLKEKYFISSILQGIGFLIHPMTAVYFIAIQAVALPFNIKYVGARKFFLYILGLLVFSSPILIWKFLHSPPSLNFIHVQQEWLGLLQLRSSHHLFPFGWPSAVFIRAGLILCLLFISWKHRPEAYHHRIIKIFVFTILAMCLAGTVFSEFLPVSIALNLQLVRSFTFIYFLAAIYYSNFFISELRSNKKVFYKSVITLMSIAIFYGAGGWKYAFAAFATFSLVLIFYRILSQQELQSKYFIFILLALMLVTASGIYIRHGNFSIHNRQEKHWLDVQLWAKENTSSYSQFIIPPYLEGFRIESERTVYCDWKDGTLMNFNPAFGQEWLRRMEKLGYKKASSPQAGFRSLTENGFISIAEDMLTKNKPPVLLVITKDSNMLSFPRAYENEKFIVYRIQ